MTMTASFIVEDGVRTEDGTSAPVALGGAPGGKLLLTLGITSVIEQQSLDVSFWISPDGEQWGEKPAAEFPQKFYAGVHAMLFDLAAYPEARYLQARWKMSRWGRGEPKPRFGFYVVAEPVAA
jgi:hypothetical protein